MWGNKKPTEEELKFLTALIALFTAIVKLITMLLESLR